MSYSKFYYWHGGSCLDFQGFVRCAFRDRLLSAYRYDDTGFRLVLRAEE